MKIQELRGYGVAASDSEGGWDKAFKAKIKRIAQKIVMGNLSFREKIRVVYWFIRKKQRAGELDLSDLRKRGMKNESFLKQQLEYIAMFSALKEVCGKETALNVMHEVMDATAAEALLLSLPPIKDIKQVGEPFQVFRTFFAVQPEAAKKAGCHDMRVTVDTDSVLQFDIHWCVWLELARRMDVPEACIPNCYADDLAYPDYFSSLGIRYRREGTLAKGNSTCDFRFSNIETRRVPDVNNKLE